MNLSSSDCHSVSSISSAAAFSIFIDQLPIEQEFSSFTTDFLTYLAHFAFGRLEKLPHFHQSLEVAVDCAASVLDRKLST